MEPTGDSIQLFNAFTSGRVSCYKALRIINRIPPIRYKDSDSIQIPNLKGNIEFKDVYFEYPSRYGIPVLTHMSLNFASESKIKELSNEINEQGHMATYLPCDVGDGEAFSNTIKTVVEK